MFVTNPSAHCSDSGLSHPTEKSPSLLHSHRRLPTGITACQSRGCSCTSGIPGQAGSRAEVIQQRWYPSWGDQCRPGRNPQPGSQEERAPLLEPKFCLENLARHKLQPLPRLGISILRVARKVRQSKQGCRAGCPSREREAPTQGPSTSCTCRYWSPFP